MTKYKVIKLLQFQCYDGTILTVLKDNIISFQRQKGRYPECPVEIILNCELGTFHGPDLNIEDYIIRENPDTFSVERESIDKMNAIEECNSTGVLSCAFNNHYVQIQRLESVHDANKFLKDIPKENVIDVKPMENNTYLVIYTKEDK